MLPLAALRRARHPTFRWEHLGRSVLCLLERRQLVRPACLVFPPTRDLPVLGRRTAKCLLGGEILHADSYAGLATAGASKARGVSAPPGGSATPRGGPAATAAGSAASARRSREESTRKIRGATAESGTLGPAEGAKGCRTSATSDRLGSVQNPRWASVLPQRKNESHGAAGMGAKASVSCFRLRSIRPGRCRQGPPAENRPRAQMQMSHRKLTIYLYQNFSTVLCDNMYSTILLLCTKVYCRAQRSLPGGRRPARPRGMPAAFSQSLLLPGSQQAKEEGRGLVRTLNPKP